MKRYGLIALLFVACGSPPPAQTAAQQQEQEQPHEHAHDHAKQHDHPQQHDHQHGHAHEHGGHHQGPLVHSFQDAEKWSQRFDAPERKAWQKPAALIAAMKISDGMTVADIGTGTGYFLPYLSPAVGPKGKVLALDIEQDMIAFVTKRAKREGLGNVEARVVALDDPKINADSVARILVVNTWHHIPNRAAYVQKLAAALQPGGSVWVVDYKLDSMRGPPKKHRLAPDEVAAELKGGGLETRIDRETLSEQYIAIGTKPQ